MVRYSVFAVFLCSFLTGSVLLVQSRGRAYRESLRQARSTASTAARTPAEPDAPGAVANASQGRQASGTARTNAEADAPVEFAKAPQPSRASGPAPAPAADVPPVASAKAREPSRESAAASEPAKQAARDDIAKVREPSRASAAARAPAKQKAEEEIAAAPAPAPVPMPAQPRTDRPPPEGSPVAQAPSSAKAVEAPAAPPEKTATTPSTKAARVSPPQTASQSSPRTEVPPPTPPTAAQAAVERWKSDPFWSQSHLTKQWNLDEFTTENEKQLGEQLNNLILRLNPEDRGSELRRVNEAAKPLLGQVARKDITYQFFVLQSEVPNAFSHPGGYVYVSRKLLDMIPEDQGHMLEFVLGHEIAHVDLRHALNCLRSPDVRRLSDGSLQKLYFLIIPYAYPNELEYEADAWVYLAMKQLDRSEHDCLQFLRILDGYAKDHGFEHGRGKPDELLKEKRSATAGDHLHSPIDNHLRAHPAAYERKNRLKELKLPALDAPK